MRHYDVIVIGTGPAGQKGAIQAAKLGKSVAVIERGPVLGGVQINTGTIPSKALREAVLHLTGANRGTLFGENTRLKKHITIGDLASVSQTVIRHEWDVIRKQFERNNIDLIWGEAHFEGPNLLQVTRADERELITGDFFLVAVGTRPAMPDKVPFTDQKIFTSDDVPKLNKLPKSMIVVGGGVIGTEYACMMGTLGIRITLVEGRNQVLGFVDDELAEALQYHMRRHRVSLRLGEKVDKIEIVPSERKGPGDTEETLVQAVLESGKKLRAETLLYAVGRQGVCGRLSLENVGVTYDDRERLQVNEHYQTSVPHVYAAGDVIGFPSLASTAMEQGRLAVCHMFGKPSHSFPDLFPYGIYGIPELSMVGKTEKQLTDEGIPYEAGICYYKEIARGQLIGDDSGMLKLLIHQDNHKLLGVHIIGTGATELIHIGQLIMTFGGTVHHIVNNVFNFPTLAEAYKVAALNGWNKIQNV